MDDVLDRVKGWSIGTGIAEGRGGYPGGLNAPGWADYVAEQRSFLDIYHAANALTGDANTARKAYFHDLAATFTPRLRLMGEGYEPHVDEEAGRLVYGLPVESGIVGCAFSFEIQRADLDVLLSDPYRRAVLESVAHTKLQRSMSRGSKPVTPIDFATIASSVLHSTSDELQRFVAAVDREYNVSTGFFVEQSMARRSKV